MPCPYALAHLSWPARNTPDPPKARSRLSAMALLGCRRRGHTRWLWFRTNFAVTFNSILAWLAAIFSAGLGLAVLFRRGRSIAGITFSAGMLLFAIETLLALAWRESLIPERALLWKTLTFLIKAILLPTWLCFSVTYGRGAPRQALAKSRGLLVVAFVLPIVWTLLFRNQITPVEGQLEVNWWLHYRVAAKILHGILLVAAVLILMNLERTFRSAVGTTQWRIKFTVIGLGVIFGARIYTRTQALLFSGQDLALMDVETVALLIGCGLIAVAYVRQGFAEIDVYPSRAVLQTSFTLLLVGAYLLIVGVFAQIVAQIGAWKYFQLQTLVVLVGIAALAVLLLSNRLRLRLSDFVGRHFKRPQHNSHQIWTRFTQKMSTRLDESSLCATAAKLLSDTFNALSVTIWRFNEQQRLIFAASTSQFEGDVAQTAQNISFSDFKQLAAQKLSRPFELDKQRAAWAQKLQQISSTQFRNGGNRICVPLFAGDNLLGFIILADRVSGVFFTVEELDLLKCIGDQLAASLLNLQLTKELMLRKEVEAFQTVSAFFVHDLKNTASTLSLMLQNLPGHFDDPDFRTDALRGIGSTVDRINQLISRASLLRRKVDLSLAEVDLNKLITEEVGNLNGLSKGGIVTKLQSLPKVTADKEQLRSVVTNLLLNAREAVENGGQITVETSRNNGWIILSVADTGCGMNPAFLENRLFRPFQTTKKKGLGIGMFQAKMIVEAHRGTIRVQSQPGLGTTFQVMLPLEPDFSET